MVIYKSSIRMLTKARWGLGSVLFVEGTPITATEAGDISQKNTRHSCRETINSLCSASEIQMSYRDTVKSDNKKAPVIDMGSRRKVNQSCIEILKELMRDIIIHEKDAKLLFLITIQLSKQNFIIKG